MSRVLFWIAVIPLFLVVVVFSVTNHATTVLSLWPVLTEPVPFPVYGIALVALFLGFVWGGIVSWFQNGRNRRRIRELQRQSEAEQREMALLRDRLSRLEGGERQATIPPLPTDLQSPPAAPAPSPAPAPAPSLAPAAVGER
ncbi:MAG TPA: LapA family protein [Rhodospirillales bacterium]|nr:LapA family protein [Rhodospirillales bacterium]